MRNQDSLTGELYGAMVNAYEAFLPLFSGEQMPDPVFTATRKKGANGYFWHGVWSGEVSEVCLCADSLAREPRDVLGTLLREMVHHWQQHNGKPGKKGYHNEEWADKMQFVGLTPRSIDNPGKMTGRKVTHTIDDGGPAEDVIERLVATGWSVPVHGLPRPPAAPRKDKSKTPYRCPTCEAKVWGKPDLSILCRDCDELFEQVEA